MNTGIFSDTQVLTLFQFKHDDCHVLASFSLFSELVLFYRGMVSYGNSAGNRNWMQELLTEGQASAQSGPHCFELMAIRCGRQGQENEIMVIFHSKPCAGSRTARFAPFLSPISNILTLLIGSMLCLFSNRCSHLLQQISY